MFPFQNNDNLRYHCFHKFDKLSVPKTKHKCYLDIKSVKFDKKNIISVVYMSISSINLNLCEIKEFLSLAVNLSDLICVCEAWPTRN